MKKSEMIKKLQQRIWDNLHDLAESKEKHAKYVAELVLEICEHEGMLPPSYNPVLFIEHNMNSISLHEFEKYMKSFNWEPENEK